MKSDDKFLFENEWLSLCQTPDGYVYAHMSRAEKGQLVCCLVYKTDEVGKVSHLLGRYEWCPPHEDGTALTSITGGVDHGSWHLPAILKELIEEAGVPEEVAYGDVQQAMADNDSYMERLEYVGDCYLSKQEDTQVHLYTFDATGVELHEKPKGDGTAGEKDVFCKWELPHIVLGCKCPLISCIAVRSGLLWKI